MASVLRLNSSLNNQSIRLANESYSLIGNPVSPVSISFMASHMDFIAI